MSDREKFSGDMSRNEVEIDLSKFMEMVTENNELKQKIWELEHDDKKNPWQKYIFLAKAVDSWRIWPRAFLSVYIFLIYFVVMWFLDLEAPTMEQSGLISILVEQELLGLDCMLTVQPRNMIQITTKNREKTWQI